MSPSELRELEATEKRQKALRVKHWKNRFAPPAPKPPPKKAGRPNPVDDPDPFNTPLRPAERPAERAYKSYKREGY
jgi:hypothetical protein